MTVKETYNSLKKEMLDINMSLSALLSEVQSNPDLAEPKFDDWRKACDDIHRIISEELVRVAVIGAVKSGKSTFVNSLFKGDYVKRGAGVVTSIVTRIRSGEKLKAVLFFKTWDEINAEIENALVMLPSWEVRKDNKPFDIRRETDRNSLETALYRLGDDMLVTAGIRNMNIVLLGLYLKGFESVADIITADSATTEYSGKNFPEHRTFVADDALAVYLKDIELEINDGVPDHSVEIADCQGSDSPNPLHLAMIQDYLLGANFLIYVISSRTGLRQADIKFLSMIKNMGILEHILFVVNIDLNEHEAIEDLDALSIKIKEELSLMRTDPDIYTFSSLFNLFKSISSGLKPKDKSRFTYWQSEKELTGFSDAETSRFETALNVKLTKQRFSLLLNNQLERMNVLVSGVGRWTKMNSELIKKDEEEAVASIEKIEHIQARLNQVGSLIKNTFQGANDNILKELKSRIDAFFNVHPGGLLEQTTQFISQYPVSVEKYRDRLEESGFSKTLYVLFQEFRQALDTFMAENINPEIAKFAKEIELKIKTSMEAVTGPYQEMAADDIAELRKIIGDTDNEADAGLRGRSILDMDAIKRLAGVELPSTTAVLQYYSKVKAETFVRLGLYSAKKFFRKMIRKPLEDEKEGEVHALQDAARLIKIETEKSIMFHFENYRENFKFQYMSRLLVTSSEHLHQRLTERLQSYSSDMKSMEGVIRKKGADRDELIAFLDRATHSVELMQRSVDSVRDSIGRVN